ncbi:MAG: hypothetical protein CL607_18830 [Anaerolineaceae bacterium]|nr:hypothetical protein [Anaerolineaceae bacterium]
MMFLLPLAMTSAQDAPPQIDLALAQLSQGERANITLDDLTVYEWDYEEFSDTSLGCPSQGQSYAQVITPGYQFLLTYDGTVYDYRVSEDGENVVFCDTRPAPADPTPPTDPEPTCDSPYEVLGGDNLYRIAVDCNTTVAALLNANPDIDDPSLIFPGQMMNIPGGGTARSVSIRPDSGPAGTTIRVFASGFPPGAQVEVGMGPPASEYVVVATREINADGELDATLQISPQIEPPQERVAVVVLNNEETVSEVFTVTDGQVSPTPTPLPPEDGAMFEQTQIYLVALGDEGRSGQQIGCGDSLIPVTVNFEPTPAPLTAALEELFAIESRTYGQSGLYNALYQSDLTVEGIDIVNGEAIIELSGSLQIGGTCDEPRVMAQIEQTALQYSTIDSVSISLNGQPLEGEI